ncbi:lipocalin family protein [Seonamhaeicola sp. ML3]|uniref:lipocalin family protein n=1 Tax=Seonamhaeicola sp. ML3 TaxID=2937786 RepID=UPI00200BF83A|nr:lipocalin family protein [Seonamhaeicola sp. ML3]
MKIFKFLSITLVLVLTSCNIESVDGESSSSSASIVGSWRMVEYVYTGETVTTGGGETLTSDFIGEGVDMDYTIVFSEEPNNLTASGSLSIKLTSTVLGQTSTQTIPTGSVLADGTWEQKGDEIITFANGQEGRMKIESLTETELVLTINQEEDLSQAGFTIISTIDAIITLERI